MPEVYTIGCQPFYNSVSECYTHIYVIDRRPLPPLEGLIHTVNTPQLSPFHTTTVPCSSYKRCVLAVHDPEDQRRLLRTGDEARLFTYLVSNGYTIDTSITKIMKTAPVRDGPRVLCLISK